MEDSALKEAARKEIIRRAAIKEMERRKAAAGQQQPEMSWGDTGIDMLKSGATGVVQGAIGLATMPQDLGRWLGNSAGYAVNRLMGSTPEEAQAIQDRVNQVQGQMSYPMLSPPSYQDVVSGIESKFGPMYKPQTVPGEYANTVGQFAAGALAGPGGVARKAALTGVPGVVSEAAGQATKGSEFEPYARMGGALLGGVAASSKGNVGTKALMKRVGDSKEAYKTVENAANKAYGNLRSAGIKYDAFEVDRAINDISSIRINPKLAPKADGLRDDVARFVGKGMNFDDLDELEKTATGLLRDPKIENTDKKFVADILTRIKQIRTSGAIATGGNMSAGEVNAAIATAKDFGRRRILGRDVQDLIDTGQGWYKSGDESGVTNQFASYGRANKSNLTKAEDAAFKKVIRREGLLGVLSSAGSRMGQIALGGVGYAIGDLTGAIGAVLGPMAARKFAEIATMKSADEALKTVLAGKSAQEAAAVLNAASRGQGRLQTLAATETGRRTAQEPFVIDAQGRQYAPTGALLGR